MLFLMTVSGLLEERETRELPKSVRHKSQHRISQKKSQLIREVK